MSGFSSNRSELRWTGLTLLALVDLVESGKRVVHADLIYDAVPNYPESHALRQRVMSSLFCGLRDQAVIKRVGARIHSRKTRNAGNVTLWEVLSPFDCDAYRATAEALIDGEGAPAPGPWQGDLPFEEERGDVEGHRR